MPEYWIEIHPEIPAYIILCNEFLDIIKRAGFKNELDVNILSTGNGFTIVLYKDDFFEKQKSRLVGNTISNIDYSDIRNVYKNVVRIPLVFEQEDKDFGTNFDVFVITYVTDKIAKKKDEPENLDDVFV